MASSPSDSQPPSSLWTSRACRSPSASLPNPDAYPSDDEDHPWALVAHTCPALVLDDGLPTPLASPPLTLAAGLATNASYEAVEAYARACEAYKSLDSHDNVSHRRRRRHGPTCAPTPLNKPLQDME
jgi:hypothetical protein